MAAEPVVPLALPLLDDEVAYTIPLTAQASDLPVEVQELWGGSEGLDDGEVTQIHFYWDNEVEPFDTQELTAPYDELDLPVVGTIPKINLEATGLHRVRYTVELVPGNAADPSLPIQINIDKQAPNQNNRGLPLIFPEEIELYGVTDDYLDDNGDQVVATVPRWSGMQLEDKAEGYLTLLPRRRKSGVRRRRVSAVASVTITQEHLDGDPIELAFEGDVLRGHANGEYSANYYLIDRAGNEGPPARNKTLFIDLTPTPTELRAVIVPQLSIDGLIDLEDARTSSGVYMEILEVFGAAPGDILVPYWDLIHLSPIEIGFAQAWPIPVLIDYPILASGGFEFNRGIIRADYTWRRGENTPRRSLPRFVPVDLTVAGPVSPDNPHPINRLLPTVTVKGSDGDNRLTINDRDQPVRVIVPLYAGPVADQELELMWGEPPVLADTYTVRAEDREGDEIEFFVDWSLIESGPHGIVPTFYWTYNGVNWQSSPDTDVLVNIIPIEGLLTPQFPDVNYEPGPDSGFIGCTTRPEPWIAGARVRIPGDSTRLHEGDEVILSWASYANTNGQAAGLIPGTTTTFNHFLSEHEAREGYDFWVPFDPYIVLPGLVKPPEGQANPRHGSAIVQYRVVKQNGGGMGDSSRELALITFNRPGNTTCLPSKPTS
ncbi:hypothetical protein OOJ96_09150 [Pseudomonas sp. 15FMM2]|uniref:Uncharacterized protein n=1 Tax=Pseudomonas imrae TaxID=2992837 RepID=A0ACC7PE78_9PSED